jgi:hypothetical protein
VATKILSFFRLQICIAFVDCYHAGRIRVRILKRFVCADSILKVHTPYAGVSFSVMAEAFLQGEELFATIGANILSKQINNYLVVEVCCGFKSGSGSLSQFY